MLIVRGRERERDKERLCAAAARSRIHGFAKSLLTTESTDWDGLYRIPFFYFICVRARFACVCVYVAFFPLHEIEMIISFILLSVILFLVSWENAIHEQSSITYHTCISRQSSIAQ